ncbi:MAG: hypothetical protein ABIG95_06880 [Candidatus Woesearchaeota archaeon]
MPRYGKHSRPGFKPKRVKEKPKLQPRMRSAPVVVERDPMAEYNLARVYAPQLLIDVASGVIYHRDAIGPYDNREFLSLDRLVEGISASGDRFTPVIRDPLWQALDGRGSLEGVLGLYELEPGRYIASSSGVRIVANILKLQLDESARKFLALHARPKPKVTPPKPQVQTAQPNGLANLWPRDAYQSQRPEGSGRERFEPQDARPAVRTPGLDLVVLAEITNKLYFDVCTWTLEAGLVDDVVSAGHHFDDLFSVRILRLYKDKPLYGSIAEQPSVEAAIRYLTYAIWPGSYESIGAVSGLTSDKTKPRHALTLGQSAVDHLVAICQRHNLQIPRELTALMARQPEVELSHELLTRIADRLVFNMMGRMIHLDSEASGYGFEYTHRQLVTGGNGPSPLQWMAGFTTAQKLYEGIRNGYQWAGPALEGTPRIPYYNHFTLKPDQSVLGFVADTLGIKP